MEHLSRLHLKTETESSLRNVVFQIKDRTMDNVQNCGKKIHGLSPRANYTDRATAACRRSDCQLLRIEGATWSA
jgi:hypothetical protein